MILYKKRLHYKYILQSDFNLQIPIKPEKNINNPYISLDVSGNLRIHQGYAWDGASGPAFDTKNFMQGSLVHDALRVGAVREPEVVP